MHDHVQTDFVIIWGDTDMDEDNWNISVFGQRPHNNQWIISKQKKSLKIPSVFLSFELSFSLINSKNQTTKVILDKNT